jgi:hypothetical protein
MIQAIDEVTITDAGFVTFELGQSIADNCPGEEICTYGCLMDSSGSLIAHAAISSVATGRK